MNGNGLVKVCFGGTHFDRNSEALEHLVAAQALHVETDHLEKRDNSVVETPMVIWYERVDVGCGLCRM